MVSHAQDRAFQRYNKLLDVADINNIKASIRSGNYMYVGDSIDKEDGKDLHFVYVLYKSIPYKILFRRNNSSNPSKDIVIVTMYPFDVDEYNILIEKDKIQRYKTYLQNNGYIVYKRGSK